MRINDYELIHLIKQEHDDLAMETLVKKYEGLIWKYIHLYCFNRTEQEDYFQEAMMMIYYAVDIFDQNQRKTFTRFFEMLLRRTFWTLVRKKPRWILHDNLSFVKETSPFEMLMDVPDFMHPLEAQIHQLYFIKRMTIEHISQKCGFSKKQIYNAVYRIREKYKEKVI